MGIGTIVICQKCKTVNIGSKLICVNCQTSLIGLPRVQGESPLPDYTPPPAHEEPDGANDTGGKPGKNRKA